MLLRQVYPKWEGSSAPEKHIDVDIIAVHGLNWRSKDDAEHAWDTWRTPDGPDGHLWLREDLPKHIPRCRVLVYEYNSTLLLGKDRDGWADKAREFLEAILLERDGVDPKRPIIFLGHSMGGLLIKQVLVNASIDPFYRSIRDATSGIAFFACPHSGARKMLVKIGSLASRVAVKLRLQKGKGDVIKVLKGEGLFDDTLQDQWRPHLLQYNLVSFWGSKDEYVLPESCRFGLPRDREAFVKLDATHRGVCKFDPASDTSRDNIRIVLFHLRDLYRKALGVENRQGMRSTSTSSRVHNEPTILPHLPLGERTRTTIDSGIQTDSSATESRGGHSQTESPRTAGREGERNKPMGPGDQRAGCSRDAVIALLTSKLTKGSPEGEVWQQLSNILLMSEDKILYKLQDGISKGHIRPLDPKVTPEILCLWVKNHVSTGIWGSFVAKLESVATKVSQHKDLTREELQDLVDQATLINHLHCFTHDQTEALRSVLMKHYDKEKNPVRRNLALGFVGLLISTTVAVGILTSTDEEWSVSPGFNLSFGGGVIVASAGFTGYNVKILKDIEGKKGNLWELSGQARSLQRGLGANEIDLRIILLYMLDGDRILKENRETIGTLSSIDINWLRNESYRGELIRKRAQTVIDYYKKFEEQRRIIGNDLGLPDLDDSLVEEMSLRQKEKRPIHETGPSDQIVDD